MQKRSNFLLLTPFLLLIFYCFEPLRAQNFSSGIDPLSIPLNTRQLYYNKGNLVVNPSFETGTRNWTVLGNKTSLTNIAQGYHAIKITRTYEDVAEVDDGPQGVLSDYIEVIPANFDFNFDIKLEKIIPTTLVDRFQTKVGDNIDIRLKFYDKDKKELDPGTYFEYVHKKVDNSFKGFAFSNYFFIDQFDWARIHGRTWDYPFSEGDVPENCRYVRIFFGLKCSGTMWVDNVDFRLSKWSFTPLERMDSLFTKQYRLSDLLLPTPKQVTNPALIDLKNKKIRLVYSGPESPETRAAVALLQKRLQKINGITIKTDNTTQFSDAFAAIQDKDQGYFIRRDSNTIYLGANTGAGLFYSACTLVQLIDEKNGKIDYADITDYPDFKGRAVQLGAYPNKWQLQQDKTLTDSAITATLAQRQKGLEQQMKDLDFYTFYKMNQLYSYASFTKKWWEPGDFFNYMYQRIGQRCAQYGTLLNAAVQLNTYIHLNKEEQEELISDSTRNLFAIGSDEGFEKIKSVIKHVLDAGVKTVQLGCDDFTPHAGIIRGEYTLYNEADKKQFANLAEAHSFLIARTKAWLDQNYPGTRLEFIPPQYNNRFIDYGRGSAEMYFKDLTSHLDSSVALIWTGNTVRSLSYDLADIRRATAIYHRKTMIFDNTPYARHVEIPNGGYPYNYPVRSTLCNIFEPFDIQYPADFSSYFDSRYYSNLTGSGEINKIKYATFGDFSWNTSKYDPELSLFKVLVQYVGKDNARNLLAFSETYYRFVATWGQLRIDRAHDSTFKISDKEKVRSEQEIKAMRTAFATLRPIGNEALKKELQSQMNAKIDAWYKLSK